MPCDALSKDFCFSTASTIQGSLAPTTAINVAPLLRSLEVCDGAVRIECRRRQVVPPVQLFRSTEGHARVVTRPHMDLRRQFLLATLVLR